MTAIRRDFSVQMTIAVAPAVTDFFLRNSDKFIDRFLEDNPGIEDQRLIDYQRELALKMKGEIHHHALALVEAFTTDYFPDTKNQISIDGSRESAEAVR